MEELQQPRVIVRFQEEVPTKGVKEPTKILTESDPTRWRKLISEFGEITLKPAITSMKSSGMQKLMDLAVERDPDYKPVNFSLFFEAQGEKVDDLETFATALRRSPMIRSSEVEMNGPPPLVDSSDDPLAVNQGYLDPAPGGIDARYAWTIDGGDGVGQGLVDVEGGWELAHEDLAAHSITLLGGTNSTNLVWRRHGTSVLGKICAVDNTVGCVGMAPNTTTIGVSSIFGSSYSGAILAALPSMNFGDVMLLELQTTASYSGGDPVYGPIEVLDINYEAIRLATAMGIIVVEAGGNGRNNGGTRATDLDAHTNYIQPGKPQQNAYIERYNRTVRTEWLGQYIFNSIEEAQHHATSWLWIYNNERPNMAIGGITPAMKLKQAA